MVYNMERSVFFIDDSNIRADASGFYICFDGMHVNEKKYRKN